MSQLIGNFNAEFAASLPPCPLEQDLRIEKETILIEYRPFYLGRLSVQFREHG